MVNLENSTSLDRIRVGKDYQVKLPDCGPFPLDLKTIQEKAILVWKPSEHLDDQKVVDYIELAKTKYNYNGEQALGMLFWHKYNLEKATQDLANFTPLPSEWTEEDKVLFKRAYKLRGKDFEEIHKMIPEKTMGSLVTFYYLWKKGNRPPKPPKKKKVEVKEEVSDSVEAMEVEETQGENNLVQN